jgi:hypothetical protein
MKNLDLNAFGVQEMNAEEMNGTNGGIFLWIAAGLATAFFWDCVMNPSDTKAQIAKGYNDYVVK